MCKMTGCLNQTSLETSLNYSEKNYVNFNSSLGESEWDSSKDKLRLAFDVIIIICMLAIMFAMGCEVKINELINHLRKPLPICIGMVAQFALIPLLGFVAVKIFQINGLYATSVLIMSCSPGGGYSNLITYLSRGDVSLSVAMTTISNILALGATPFNVWLYSHGVETESINIPYKQMGVSMLGLTIILSIGIALRWRFPNVASIITKVGVVSSGVMAIACGILALVLYPKFFQNIPGFLFCAIAFVGPLGLAIAYCGAWLMKLAEPIRRTIAIESAVQNVGTAITIVIISFSKSALKEMSVYIILYSAAVTCGLLAVASGLALRDYINSNAKSETRILELSEIKLDAKNTK